VYRASDTSAGAIRDEKVLSNLWESSLRGLPNIVRYSPLNVLYEGARPAEEKKYIVSYDFGAFKPYPLHGELLSKLDASQKMMVMHDIAAGLNVLHNAGIYHRNLQPNSVFVFFDRGSRFVQAKLVGFEYAKIEGDNATVFASVAKRMEQDPSAFFSMVMQQGLKNRQIAARLDWAREDIYSLGALFYFILTGEYPGRVVDTAKLAEKADSEMTALVASMVNPNITARPDVQSVLARLEPKYTALL
jgi:serine/threonine protein kinase